MCDHRFSQKEIGDLKESPRIRPYGKADKIRAFGVPTAPQARIYRPQKNFQNSFKNPDICNAFVTPPRAASAATARAASTSTTAQT